MSIAPVSSPSTWPTPVAASSASGLPAASSSSSDSSSAAQWFTDYMSKTPAEHMRDSILESMGYTEDDLKTMDPKKRQAIEDELTKRLKDQALHQTQDQKKAGVLIDVQA